LNNGTDCKEKQALNILSIVVALPIVSTVARSMLP